MMTPELQMKEPYRFNYDNINSVDVRRYMSESGFIGGLSAAWDDYVHEMFGNFEAGIAANEGIEAVIRDLMPARRRLYVSKMREGMYAIECVGGGARAYLAEGEDDSLTFSFNPSESSDNENIIDLGYYDSLEAASFIGHAFKAYRELNDRFRNVLYNC